MANITPFRGTLYNPEKIKDPAKVTAPPYDVISPEEQEALYNSDPHNIIRILLGKDLPCDNEKENKYIRAKRSLDEWQKKAILKRDDRESIYVYQQEFEVDGKVKKRLGFIALLKLEEFDTSSTSVYPHEYTLDAPKKDRTSLLSTIEANLGPIFALFADEDKAIDAILAQEVKTPPTIDVVDFHGMRNKLWRVSCKDTVAKIVELMKKENIFIADGHHRYEVALAFSKTKKDPRYGYILSYFTDLCADGLVILPVHRLIKGLSLDILEGLKKDLSSRVSFKGLSSKEEAASFLSGAKASEKRFVMYVRNKFTGLQISDSDSLDVTVLHDLIIEPLKKMTEQKELNFSVDFTKDLNYAVDEVDMGRFFMSILLNPTKITEIRDTAFSGRRMPQKSTYFYPKVLTGLVINVF